MEDLGENMKSHVNANINNLKTTFDSESVSSKSSSDSSEILQSEPLAQYNSLSANESKNGFPGQLTDHKISEASNSDYIAPSISHLPRDSSSSRSSSSSSSLLSDHLPSQPHLKIQIEAEDKTLNQFSLSSPIMKPTSKSKKNENPSDPGHFNFELTEDKSYNIRDSLEESKSSEVLYSDEDTVNDLQAIDDALTPNKGANEDFVETGELDQAIVMEDSLDKSSSSSSNSEILKDIKEEPDSPEKFKPNDLYHHQVDSPGIVEQAVSYLPSDFIEEKMKEEQTREKNVSKHPLSNKENKTSANVGASGVSKGGVASAESEKMISAKGGKDEVGKEKEEGSKFGKKDGTETKMMTNSLIEAKKYEKEKEKREDPKGSSVCAKCLIL